MQIVVIVVASRSVGTNLIVNDSSFLWVNNQYPLRLTFLRLLSYFIVGDKYTDTPRHIDITTARHFIFLFFIFF